MRVTANMSADNSLYNLQQGRSRLDRLQETITSAQNINRPSDDPIGSNLLLDIGDKMKAFDQYNANIVKAKSWMQFSDTALNAMNDIMNQTQSLMNTITSGSADPSERQLAHDQLVELKKQMVDFANTQYGDQYIFGGADNLSPPFNYANNLYGGDGTERVIEIASDTPHTISITGDRLMKGTGTNPSYGNVDILQMFDNLIAAVGDATTPSNPAALTTAIQSLTPASKQIFNAVNTNLSRMTRVDNMSKLNEVNKNTLTNIIGNIQNVDMIKLGVQLNTEKNAFEASLSATAKLSQMSLLNYL
jgi:flagellar hook-associated protein 3 FlgL